MSKDNKSIRIGLVFPELGKHDYNYFMEILHREKNRLDMIVFPEGFETITPTGKDITPETVKNDGNVKLLLRKYSSLSLKYNIGVIVGFQVDYKNSLISGGENDQYCAFVSPQGDNYVYHKHSTSRFNAFFDSNWSIENNLKTVQIKDINIGISICHDSYISLISRLLSKKGADVWVNISYQNVRPNIWEPIHLTRAVENNIISLCTLHRNSKASNPQKEPYAFSPVGKIRLKDLQTNKYIDEFSESKRTGKIYFFDTIDHTVIHYETPDETALSAKADRMSIRKENNTFNLNRSNNDFNIKEISMEDYFSPEVLWGHSLKYQDKTTIFIVRTQNKQKWDDQRVNVLKTIKGRTIEFSTVFVFVDKSNNILLSAYRSSNYKDCRIFYPDGFPITIDKRYLKGIVSTSKISLDDYRNEDDSLYFERVKKIIDKIDSL